MWNPAASLRTPCLVWAVASTLLLAPAASAVTIDWVTVGDPGNAADDTGFGSVATIYRIGETEVTNAQYAEFLNAVAAEDPNGLYNTQMGNTSTSSPFGEPAPGFGGIARSGSSGSFSYSTIAGREHLPVNHVSFLDALRFANWLHNGQPTGAQGNTTTEHGAYTMAPGLVTRNPGATHFLPSEDEWYKAAYYDALTTSYFNFPAGTDAPTVCAPPSGTPNTANCGLVNGDLTDVGSYTGSASPAGTFDQGGNVWEYNEAIVNNLRGLRGGDFRGDPLDHRASSRSFTSQTDEANFSGFRVAMVPEPGTGLLLMTGVLGLAGWRRHRA